VSINGHLLCGLGNADSDICRKIYIYAYMDVLLDVVGVVEGDRAFKMHAVSLDEICMQSEIHGYGDIHFGGIATDIFLKLLDASLTCRDDTGVQIMWISDLRTWK
jgi:hypothetical protein